MAIGPHPTVVGTIAHPLKATADGHDGREIPAPDEGADRADRGRRATARPYGEDGPNHPEDGVAKLGLINDNRPRQAGRSRPPGGRIRAEQGARHDSPAPSRDPNPGARTACPDRFRITRPRDGPRCRSPIDPSRRTPSGSAIFPSVSTLEMRLRAGSNLPSTRPETCQRGQSGRGVRPGVRSASRRSRRSRSSTIASQCAAPIPRVDPFSAVQLAEVGDASIEPSTAERPLDRQRTPKFSGDVGSNESSSRPNSMVRSPGGDDGFSAIP